jgi:hypothetical protein
VKPRQRRGTGTLGQLKGRLWAVIEYSTRLVEDEIMPHELRLKSCHALTQAAMAYCKITEQTELEARIQALERAATERNGHR